MLYWGQVLAFVAIFWDLIFCMRRINVLESRNEELENQIIYLETCFFGKAVLAEKRHRETCRNGAEGTRP